MGNRRTVTEDKVKTIDLMEAHWKDLGIHSSKANKIGAWWYITLVRWTGSYHAVRSGKGSTYLSALVDALNDVDKRKRQ